MDVSAVQDLRAVSGPAAAKGDGGPEGEQDGLP
jgi:hypothetical protein